MKAAVLREFGKPLTIEDVETPVPGPDDVLIKVHACGIDGTDLKLLDGFGYHPELPFIMGHEPAGVVHAVGSAVTDFQVGDRVVTYNFFVCGKCTVCRSNREQLCPHMTGVLGVKGKAGGYAEYLNVPARQVLPVPASLNFNDAAVLCDAGITAFHAVDRSRACLGETSLIFGVGGVGSFAVQYAKLAGTRVIAVDQSAEKCARAKTLGADEVINGSEQNVTEMARELTNGSGVDCVIDIVGREATISAGINSLANGGRIVIVGYTPDEYHLSGKQLAQNELELIGTRCGRKRDLLQAAQLAANGSTQSIVTDTYPIAEVNEALAKLREGNVLGRCVLQI
ncbi:MAG: zinc-binding dehydrogenase [Pirellulaceae bacterium]|nr:zinc-binding dehydrogenase [Pirellulaceae bacterium]